MDTKLEAIAARLEAATAKLEAKIGSGGGGAGDDSQGSDAQSVAAFDAFISGSVEPFVASGKALGDAGLSKQLDAFSKAFQEQHAFLSMASKSKKPSLAKLPGLLKPLQTAMGAIEACVERGDFFDHQKGLAEGAGCLGWVTIEPAPCGFISEFSGSFLFYGNKVLRQFKGKDDRHVTYVTSFKDLVTALEAYVKEYHRTGVTWNPKGGEASVPAAGGAPAAPGAPAPPAPGAPAPPAPGAPAPPAPGAPAPSSSAAAPPDTSALFAAINSGNVTSGLKKVTDDMKTHKNPTLRGGGVVPASNKEKAAAAAAAPKKAAAAVKPPRIELEGKKWWIENQVDNKEIVIADVDAKQSVFISNCDNCVIQVQGKINQITIERAKKTGVVFESVVSCVEVVNSKRVQVQCTGALPSLSMDRVEDAQVYLGKDSLGCVITTSLASDVNVVTPGKTEQDDMSETPIPYQFQTTIKDGVLVTEPVRHE